MEDEDDAPEGYTDWVAADAKELNRLRGLLLNNSHGICCAHRECHRCGLSERSIQAEQPSCEIEAPPTAPSSEGLKAETAAPSPLPSIDDPTGLIEYAWGIIANAGGGNWENESREWREAAHRWGVLSGYRWPNPAEDVAAIHAAWQARS